jgi:holo-[acyl-carrier protein] synthase
MIYGIGVDLVDIKRLEKAIDRWGERFLNKIFTARESDFCLGRSRSAPHFAMRFAAKEAFSKAIGLGMRKGIQWRDIEIIQNSNGKPELNVTGKALDYCDKGGISGRHVTLSDEAGYCIAIVVLETNLAENKIKGVEGP